MLFIAGLSLLLCSALGARSVEDSCPKGALEIIDATYFSVLDDTCYLFMTYDRADYWRARGKCYNDGGSLAMPKTQALHDFLSEELMRFNDDGEAMWIGANDVVVEGYYEWEDGSEMLFRDNMNYWNGGLFGHTENCLALKLADRQWHDYSCDRELPFICQYPIQVQETDVDDEHDVPDHGVKIGKEDQVGEDEEDKEGQVGGDKDVEKVQDGDEPGQIDNDVVDVVEEDKCEKFDCPDLECGMDGFKLEDGCQICECNK